MLFASECESTKVVASQFGGIPGKMMPVTWTRVVKATGGRVFYTRYDPDDLKKDEGCRQMVARALFWAADREIAAVTKKP